MTELAQRVGRQARDLVLPHWPANGWRLVLVAALAAIALSSPELRELVVRSISDAYLQVTVFVAGTLALVYSVENLLKFNLGEAMSRARRFQAPIAAFLGALPGCGGAIIVVTQYTRGLVSFGSVVTVLIATMGDAAFLLIAREPMTGLMMMAVGFTVGTVSGWIVDAIHGPDFMRGGEEAAAKSAACLADTDKARAAEKPETSLFAKLSQIWIFLAVPGVLLGLMVAMQHNSDQYFGALSDLQPTRWIGVFGGILCLTMWAIARRPMAHGGDPAKGGLDEPMSWRVVKDTNFVTSWVVVGFLSYELLVHFAGTGVETWLTVWAPFVPLVAIAVGFIPGCGPQIVVTTLYLAGAIPLSAQFANAIANDGDALFPALALAPRAAILATLYSAIPALIVGYGYFFLFE